MYIFAALVFDLFDNKRKFNFKTNLFGTNSPRLSDKKGFRGQIQLSELRGKFRFQLFWTGIDKYYNQNELGFFNLKNAQSFRATVRYRIEKENKILRSYSNYFMTSQRHRFDSFLRTGGGWRFGNDFVNQNLTTFEIDFDYLF